MQYVFFVGKAWFTKLHVHSPRKNCSQSDINQWFCLQYLLYAPLLRTVGSVSWLAIVHSIQPANLGLYYWPATVKNLVNEKGQWNMCSSLEKHDSPNSMFIHQDKTALNQTQISGSDCSIWYDCSECSVCGMWYICLEQLGLWHGDCAEATAKQASRDEMRWSTCISASTWYCNTHDFYRVFVYQTTKWWARP